MLRLIVLVATLAAVAQSTTLLYPSSYRQVAWPVQSQYPSSLQYSNYYPYTTVYRYPLEVQLLPYQQKYQYVQQTPYYTQTRTLPLVWGRSFGEHVSPAPSQVSQSVSPYVAPQVSQYPSVGQVAAPVAPVAPVSQPSSFIGQPSSYMGQSGFVSQPVASPVSSGYAQPPLHAGHFVSQLSAPVPVQQQSFASPRSTPQGQFENAYPVSPAFPRYSPAPVQPALIAPQGGQTVVGFIPNGEPVSAHPQSVPVAYSVDYPRTQVVQAAPGGVQQAPAVFSPIPIQQSYVHGQPQPQQQSVGQHQVAQVAIPAGGYSSATYYETAPASVVIPSVPLSQEPIVAADVKSVASKATIDGQTVHSQVQPQVPHQRVQAVQTY